MRNMLIVGCVAVTVGAIAQTAPSDSSSNEPRGLLSRLRGNTASTRQQVQNQPVEVAQPANSPQGYRPGVTFPQQQAQPQQPQQPVYPGYPPYGVQANPYYPPQQRQATPTPAQTPSSRSSSSSDDDDNDSRESRSSSSNRSSPSRQSGSSSSRSSSASSGERKSSSSSDSSSKKESSSSSSDRDDSSEKKSSSSSDSGSKSSALEKIAKKVESGKAEGSEKSDSKEDEPRKTKEEIELEKAREAALKSADKATTVVAEFLQQANDGYYSKAADALAPAIQKYFQSEISAVNGTQKAVLDELTANGTITMVTYVNRVVRGEGAEVEAELVYEDGRTVRRTFDLIEIEDEWKIVLPVKPGATASPAAASATVAPTPTPQPVAPPPSAEQAAANAPMVLIPGPVSADAATTSAQ